MYYIHSLRYYIKLMYYSIISRQCIIKVIMHLFKSSIIYNQLICLINFFQYACIQLLYKVNIVNA